MTEGERGNDRERRLPEEVRGIIGGKMKDDQLLTKEFFDKRMKELISALERALADRPATRWWFNEMESSIKKVEDEIRETKREINEMKKVVDIQ